MLVHYAVEHYMFCFVLFTFCFFFCIFNHYTGHTRTLRRRELRLGFTTKIARRVRKPFCSERNRLCACVPRRKYKLAVPFRAQKQPLARRAREEKNC